MLTLTLPLALAACGGEDTDNNANNNDNNNAPLDWANLDAAGRGAYMASDVLPRMTTVLQDFDATRYASVTCDTCHVDSATNGFTMPNPGLPKLPMDLAPVFTSSPAVANFMSMQVVPEIAALLELDPFDPATGTGDISCFTCHTME